MGRYYCFECEDDITEEEYLYSKKHFKKALCRDCQPSKKARVKKVIKSDVNNEYGKYRNKKKKCMKCGKYNVLNSDHDFCHNCFSKVEKSEVKGKIEDSFKEDLLEGKIYTVYVMFYGDNNKVGYTADLDSRFVEIIRKYGNNELVYFREFTKESEARRFEAWLKKLSERKLNRFVSVFQNKVKKMKVF